jgi:hypothetical protein
MGPANQEFTDDHYISLFHLPAAPISDSENSKKQKFFKKDCLQG